MPLPDGYWHGVCLDVLEAVQGGYVTRGVDLPERQLVTPGAPAWDVQLDDCSGLLAVQLERIFNYAGDLRQELLEGNQAMPGWALRGAVVSIHLVRCVPTLDDNGDPPPAADEQDAAEVINTDAQRLLNCVIEAAEHGDIGGCSALAFENWRSVGPEGGWAGGILTVRLGT